jgi:hypothetical protein
MLPPSPRPFDKPFGPELTAEGLRTGSLSRERGGGVLLFAFYPTLFHQFFGKLSVSSQEIFSLSRRRWAL